MIRTCKIDYTIVTRGDVAKTPLVRLFASRYDARALAPSREFWGWPCGLSRGAQDPA